MATPNYGYEKRQRELAKKQKKEDKARAKTQRRPEDPPEENAADGAQPDDGAPAQPAGSGG